MDEYTREELRTEIAKLQRRIEEESDARYRRMDADEALTEGRTVEEVVLSEIALRDERDRLRAKVAELNAIIANRDRSLADERDAAPPAAVMTDTDIVALFNSAIVIHAIHPEDGLECVQFARMVRDATHRQRSEEIKRLTEERDAARAEVERLRDEVDAANAAWQEECTRAYQLRSDVEAKTAERDAARAALREIMEWMERHDKCPDFTLDTHRALRAAKEASRG